MVIQNKLFPFKIKRQAKNVFPSDVERTVVNINAYIKLIKIHQYVLNILRQNSI